jgi:hypothetical protein
MTREQLEKESSNSAANLGRDEETSNGQFDEKGAMQKTLSSSQLKQMLEENNQDDN